MLSSQSLWLLTTAVPMALGIELPGGIGRLPPMGWNSWNAYACAVDADKMVTAAQALVSKGFKDAGYIYVNQDDCWGDYRDNDTQRIVPNMTRYPNGISGLASQIHGMGLKFGLYSTAGLETCAGYPASLGYEQIDAETFADWGIDYLKYDNCNVPEYWADACYACAPEPTEGYPSQISNGTCIDDAEFAFPKLCGKTWPTDSYNYSESYTAQRFRIMGNALSQQNRTILYSLCEWGQQEPWTWGNEMASIWRATGDIAPYWGRVAAVLNEMSFLANFNHFSGHNDADMLEVGNGNLTLEENRSHFALWALMKAPLIIGTDLTNLTQQNMDILLNKYLIAFNQDSVVEAPAQAYKWGVNPDWTFNATNPAEYWSGPSSNGTMVAMLNTLSSNNRKMTATFSEIPELKGHNKYRVTNVWTGEDLGCISKSITTKVKSHDTAVYLVHNSCEKSSANNGSLQ